VATETYRGMITVGDHGDSMDVLFLGHPHYEEPLAELICDDIEEHGNYLTVRYWTADAPMSDDAIKTAAVRLVLGDADVKFEPHYSEITGYLWTTEEIEVGGHDLLEELTAQVGRYCLLEITYDKEKP
jgi:hypothetical protein